MINHDQLLVELWESYPDVVFDDDGKGGFKARGPWVDTKKVVGKHIPDPNWGVIVPEYIEFVCKKGKTYKIRVDMLELVK